MRFFRWLLSNVLLIIIVVGLIYTYVYWGNLTGSDTPGGKVIAYLSDESVLIRDFVDGIKEKNREKNQQSSAYHEAEVQPATFEGNQTSSATMVTTSQKPADVARVYTRVNTVEEQGGNTLPAVQEETTEKADNFSSSHTVMTSELKPHHDMKAEKPPKQPVTISYSQNKQRVEQDSNGQVMHIATSSTVAQSDVTPVLKQAQTLKPGKFVTPEVEKELENASADGGVAALTPDATRKVWIEARKSFYKREYEQSENRYKRVISMTKNNFDAYGELGNVYFYQGKNDEAADAYMKAASILVDLGHADRARSLVGLMHYLDSKKAKELEQKLEAAQ